MNNLTLVTYTHSKCTDLHHPYLDRINKFFPELQYHLLTCNTQVDCDRCIVYDDKDSHSNQMINVLSQVTTDFVIYSQEDYILFDRVDVEKLQACMNLLDVEDNIHFIRLIKSGVGSRIGFYNKDFDYLDCDGDYYFSTQITLWRRNILIELYKKSQVASVFDEPLNSKHLKEMGAVGLFHKQVGKSVGGHYNSTIYPYIATAKVKGRWNTSEYPDELNQLFKEYNKIKIEI